MKAMLRINFPIHFVPFVIFKLKKLGKEGIIRPVAKLLFNILRSVLFMTGYVSAGKIVWANVDSFPLGYMPYKLVDFLINFLPPAFIAFEQPHKRVDITYFLMKSSAESWWNIFRNRKLVPNIPRLGELMTVLALSIIAFKFSEEFVKETKKTDVTDTPEKTPENKPENKNGKSCSLSGLSLKFLKMIWSSEGH